MFKRLKKTFKYMKLKTENDSLENRVKASEKEEIPKALSEIKEKLHQSFAKCSDFIMREVTCGNEQQRKILIAFIEGIIDKNILNRDIINPIVSASSKAQECSLMSLKMSIIYNCETQEVDSYDKAIDEILYGNTVVFIDGEQAALKTSVRAESGRAVDEPDTEAVVRGPREGFVEGIRVNTALIRKKIRDTNLKIETMRIGTRTKTEVAICYINGIAKAEIVEQVKRRLKKIKTDAILESGYIEEFIEDNPLSILATITNTQKPDIAVAKILEGRVAIIVDGTPHVLTVPHVFVENIQVNEDYYQRHYIASILRGMRLLSLLISILLPGIYVALQTFHQEMIPTVLLISMAGAREGVPFPALIEALIMSFAFELLRESGIRLPRPIGSAISIVGALIIGEAAVQAGLVGAPMVIVTALTGIASFIVPTLTEAMIIYRFIILMLGGTMGLYGVTCGVYIITAQALSLKSFGIPYGSTLAPFRMGNMKDFILRLPYKFMIKRPALISDDQIRQGKRRRQK